MTYLEKVWENKSGIKEGYRDEEILIKESCPGFHIKKAPTIASGCILKQVADPQKLCEKCWGTKIEE